MDNPVVKTIPCVLLLGIVSYLVQVNSSSINRQKYGGRVLNIAPISCTSSKFPNLEGVCMISLECQQRSGTVIGACRDGLLFGACCHEPNPSEVVTVTTVEPSLTEPFIYKDTEAKMDNLGTLSLVSVNKVDQNTITVKEESTTKAVPVLMAGLPTFNKQIPSGMRNHARVSSGNLHMSLPKTENNNDNEATKVKLSENKIDAIQLNNYEPQPTSTLITSTSSSSTTTTLATIMTTQTKTTTTPATTTTTPAATTTTPAATTTTPATTTTKPATTTTRATTTTTPATTTTTQVTTPKAIKETTTRPTVTTTTTAKTKEGESLKSNSSTESTNSTPEQTTLSSPTTKFFYGKIKYTPKSFKVRSTTKKTVWTRPPTTETSYLVFNNQNSDEEEDDDEYKRVSTRRGVSTSTSTSSSSLETTTQKSDLSSETAKSDIISSEMSTSAKLNEVSSESSTLPTTTEVLATPTPTLSEAGISVIKNAKPMVPPHLQNKTDEIEAMSEINPSQFLHKVGTPYSRKPTAAKESASASASWDNKIEEFVNQVVEGIATELDKANIDEVVFSPSSKHNGNANLKKKQPVKSSDKKVVSVKTKHTKKSKVTTSAPPTRSTPLYRSKSKKKPNSKVTTSKDSTPAFLDYRKDCGVRSLPRQSRIVGGSPSNYGSWPWHALVKETVWWGIFSKVKCGGVLIGSRHILTAAHCQPQKTGTLSVVLGVTDSDNPNINAVTKGVRRIMKHPEFNPRSYENDIAILELDSPVEFQPHIVPICLPDLKEIFEGNEGFVTGMGLLKHDGERPLVLHEVDVPILNNSECQLMFRKSGNSKPIKESFICAGYPQGLKDSCGGDSGSYSNIENDVDESDEEYVNETEFFSGGPLSVRRPNGQWVICIYNPCIMAHCASTCSNINA